MRHLTIGLAITFMFVAWRGVDIHAVEASECKEVQGHQEETLVTGAACTSPVGLYTVAQMFGAVQGEAQFTASAIIPSADTPTTGVVFVIGNTVIEDATVAGRHGAAPDFIEGPLEGRQPAQDVVTARKVLQVSLAIYEASRLRGPVAPDSLRA